MGVDAARLLPIGALAAPILIVQGARLLVGGGPEPAPAAELADPSPGVTPEEGVEDPIGPISESDRELMEWIRSQRVGLRDVASPLDHPEEAPASDPVGEGTPAPTLPSLPPMRVTGVVGSGEGGYASINGQVHRVGDEIAPGWTLVSVDARHQVIELRSRDGRRVELRPGRP